jgi:hypothetical protein
MFFLAPRQEKYDTKNYPVMSPGRAWTRYHKGVLAVTYDMIQEGVLRDKKAKPSTCGSICDTLPASDHLSEV